MAGDKRGFKTGDFVLCKWDGDATMKEEGSGYLCASVSVVRTIHGMSFG